MQDVTALRQTARRLAELNQGLTEADEFKADMIAMLSHDARQPLAAIILRLSTLLAKWDSMAETAKVEAAAQTEAMAWRVSHLFDDTLAMINVESGTISSSAQSFDLVETVREAIGQVDAAKTVFLRTSASSFVNADPFQVRQIVTNLIGNALKYGAPPVEVVIETLEDRSCIQILDRGPGVSEDFVPHLFERFVRSTDHASKRSGGAGFGLYIAKKLAEVNRASLTYEPRRPGACFKLCLPGRGANTGYATSTEVSGKWPQSTHDASN
jgi:signal transduction histidine kinase